MKYNLILACLIANQLNKANDFALINLVRELIKETQPDFDTEFEMIECVLYALRDAGIVCASDEGVEAMTASVIDLLHTPT